MRKKIFSILSFIVLLSIVFCKLPTDPSKDPSNASVKFESINNQPPVEPVSVVVETPVTVKCRLNLSNFIDSIGIFIISTDGYVESSYFIKENWTTGSISTVIKFPSAGTKRCIITSYNSNSSSQNDTLIFSVAFKSDNKSPVWYPDTVQFISNKGVKTSRSISPFGSDVDANPLTFKVELPAGAQFSFVNNTLSSDASMDTGTYAIRATVSDGVLSDVGVIIWKIRVFQSTRTIVVNDTVRTAMNTAVAINVLNNDLCESGAPVLSYVSQGKHGLSVIVDKKVLYMPENNFIGNDTCSYFVNELDSGKIFISVSNTLVNRKPLWNIDTLRITSEKGKSFQCDFESNASDADGDSLIFTATLPANANFVQNKNIISTIGIPDTGRFLIPVRVSDSKDTSTQPLIILWKVFTGNIAPVWSNDTIKVFSEKGKPGTCDLGLYVTNPKNDPLLFGAKLPQSKDFSRLNGIISTTGALDTGKYIFEVSASDSYMTVNAFVMWNVTMSNQKPVWRSDTITISSEKGKTGRLNLKEHVSDPEAAALTFAAALPSSGFTRTDSIITSTTTLDTGRYVFGVTASDNVTTVSAVVIWRVILLNQVPAWKVDTIKVNYEKGKAGRLNLKEFASDPEGSALTFSALLPSRAFSCVDSLISASGTLDTGVYTFAVTASDGSLSATVPCKWTVTPAVTTVTVDALNDSAQTYMNVPVTIDVLKNDLISGDTLIISKVNVVKHGTAVIQNNKLLYTPQSVFTGKDTVSYVANEKDSANVVITILPIVYTMTNDTIAVLQGGMRVINVLNNDKISFGTLKVTAIGKPKLGTATFTDIAVEYSSNATSLGKDTMIYYVNGKSDSGKIIIDILAIKIVARTDTISLNEDASAVAINVLQNDSISSGILTITSVTQGKFGRADTVGNKVVYTPNPNQNGIDTIKYLVNNAEQGIIRITIRPVNDIPVFNKRSDSLTINEGVTESLVFTAHDADGVPVALTIKGNPAWISTPGATDSISVNVSPTTEVVNSSNSPLAFSFTLQGVSGTDTIRHTVKIKVVNVNAAPVFATADTFKIDEGAVLKKVYAATDGDGDVVEITILSKPSWVTSVSSIGSIELTASPDFSLASATTPNLIALVRLQASDGTTTTSQNVFVRVSNVNRPPSFTTFPESVVSSAMYDSIKTTALTYSDPDGDIITPSLVSPPPGMTLGTDGIIRWFVPNSGYVAGSTIPVTVSITDGVTPVRKSFSIQVTAHKWKLVNSNFTVTYSGMNSVMAAAGKDTLFITTSGPYPAIYRSTDGGVTWSETPFVTFTTLHSYASVQYMTPVNQVVFIAGPSYGSSFVGSFPFNSSTSSTTLLHGSLQSYSISADGRRVLAQYDSIGTDYSVNPCFYYSDGTLTRVKDRISKGIKYLSSGNTYCWGIADTFNVWLLTTFNSTSDSLGFKQFTRYTTQINKIFNDANNGDTAYATTSYSSIYQLHTPSSSKEIVPIMSFSPTGLCMLSGSKGWIWDSSKTGGVYFTNDAFTTTIRETLLDGAGNPVKIVNIFKSSNGLFVFAFTRDERGNMKLFRY